MDQKSHERWFFRVFRFCSQILETFLLAIWGSPNYLETPQLFSDVFSSSEQATWESTCRFIWRNPRFDRKNRKMILFIFRISSWVKSSKLRILKTTRSPTLRFADSTYHHPWFIQVCPFQAWCVCISTTINLMKIGGIGEWALWRFARKWAEDKKGEKITWVGCRILIYFGSRKICDPNFHDVTLPLFEYLPYRCRN